MNREWLEELVAFMSAIERDEESRHSFHPHGSFASELEMREKLSTVTANASGKDPYFLGFDESRAVAYGFLRGWSEGFTDAFLGVAVRPDAQGQGYGRAMMLHLIMVAAKAAEVGASRELKLSVYKTNARAISLYQSLGFILSAHPRGETEYLGILDLTPWIGKAPERR